MSVGEENGLRVRIFGTKAGLDWKQENPNYLDLLYANEPSRVYKRGNDYLDPIVKHNSRLPFGHPEGFIEAFANIYLNVARTISAKLSNEQPGEFDTDFPTVYEGARGVHFIHKAIESGRKKGWVDAVYSPPA